MKINPKNWRVTTGKAIGRSVEITQINNLLEEVRSSLHNIYHEMQCRDNFVTAEKVMSEFLGHGQTNVTLSNIFTKHNEYVKTLVGISKSAATYQKYMLIFHN